MKKNIIFYALIGIFLGIVIVRAFSNSYNITALKACKSLKEKYGEGFVALNAEATSDKDIIKIYARPIENGNVVFTVLADGKGNIQDDYVSRLVLTGIRDSITGAAGDCGMESTASIYLESERTVIEESDKTIMPNSFFDKYEVSSVAVSLIYDKDSFKLEEVIPALEKSCKGYARRIDVMGYVISHDEYEKCKQQLAKTPAMSNADIENLACESKFYTYIVGGESALTTDVLKSIINSSRNGSSKE